MLIGPGDDMVVEEDTLLMSGISLNSSRLSAGGGGARGGGGWIPQTHKWKAQAERVDWNAGSQEMM
jgi:hypothetical protein